MPDYVIRYDEAGTVMRSTGDHPGMLTTRSDNRENFRFAIDSSIEVPAGVVEEMAPGDTRMIRMGRNANGPDLSAEEAVDACVDLVAVSMLLRMVMGLVTEIVAEANPIGHFEAIEEVAAFARDVRERCNARAPEFFE